MYIASYYVGYSAIFGVDARPDIAYGSIIPSYIAIADNFNRSSLTKGLNDCSILRGEGGNKRPRSQITDDLLSVNVNWQFKNVRYIIIMISELKRRK